MPHVDLLAGTMYSRATGTGIILRYSRSAEYEYGTSAGAGTTPKI